jgi:MFS family permease
VHEVSGARSPRSRRQLLLTSAVGPLTLGKVLSTLAVWTTNIAGAILVYELTGSATMVGAVSVAQFLPQLLLTPWSGARADRSDRVRQLMLGVSITTFGSLVVLVWSALVGLQRPQDAFAVILAAGLIGTGFSIGGPATSALLPSLVRRDELADAIALSSLPIIIARAAGPATGAVLFLTLGATRTYLLASALHIGFLLTLVGLRRALRATPARTPSADRRIRAGFRYVRADRRLQLTLLGVAVIGVGVDPVTTLTPSLAAALGAPSSTVGVLSSTFGVGAAVGFVVLSRIRLMIGLTRLATTGLALLAAGLMTASLAGVVPVAAAGLGFAGFGMTLALNAFTTLVQSDLPDGLRGRIMALWAMAFLGSRPITAAVSGALTDLTSVRAALMTTAGVVALGALLTRPTRIGPVQAAPNASSDDVPGRRTPMMSRAKD